MIDSKCKRDEKYRSLNKLGSAEDCDEDEGVKVMPAPSDNGNVEMKTMSTSKTIRKNANKLDVSGSF